MQKTINIASLQTARGLEGLDYYLSLARSRGARILCFGEYVFDPFFKDLDTSKRARLKSLVAAAREHVRYLKKLASVYKVVIVAPLITFKAGAPVKTMAIFRQKSLTLYAQSVLIDYKHWNEKAFFAPAPLAPPPCFNVGGFKFSVAFGYELHLSAYWEYFSRKKVDCVLLSSASTFNSKLRWREIIKTRGLLGNYYILRTNKIGERHDGEHVWKFYGDSLLCNPSGHIEDFLSAKEELLVATLDKMVLKNARADWGFNALNERLLNERIF